MARLRKIPHSPDHFCICIDCRRERDKKKRVKLVEENPHLIPTVRITYSCGCLADGEEQILPLQCPAHPNSGAIAIEKL